MIRSSIIHGNIDEAIQLIDAYFPGVLQEEGRGQELQLWLKCGKFVEMMREYCEHNKSRRPDGRRMSVDLQSTLNRGGSEDHSRSKSICNGSVSNSPIPTASSPSPTPMPGRRLSYAAIAASLSPSTSTETPRPQQADMMDIDEQLNNDTMPDNSTSLNGIVWNKRSSILSDTSNGLLGDNTLNGEDYVTTNNGASQSLKMVMQYGQNLQEEYRHDTREKTRSSLVVSSFCLSLPLSSISNYIGIGNLFFVGIS